MEIGREVAISYTISEDVANGYHAASQSLAAAAARDPPYLHPPVTASVFWAITLRVQEFDKGRGPVGFPADWAGS
jgi:hypothetical protein